MFFLFFLLISSSSGGQIPVLPIYSPCEFPTPILPSTHFDVQCKTHGSSKLKFICDLNHQLQFVPLTEVEQHYDRFRSVFEYGNRSHVGIVLVRHLEQPSSAGSVYEDSRYSCLFNEECARLDAEVIAGFSNNVKMFLKVYAWKLYDRWFGNSDGCQTPHILVLISVDGLVNDARKIPYVKIHSGDNRLRFPLNNIEIETANALVQNLPIQQVLKDLIVDLGIALKELHDLNGEPRDHSVPRWARHLGLLCVGLIAFALITEWYIVRRKLAVKKSASGIKIVSGKSKTHLMF
ncbi:hypothetical protein PRIPAC_71341 [Pristionchus pacificus]|uniref:Uncharacterized protein n=1 Tax=Pristionchus pacificus TaxID=54126 RepID=A0A2A6D0C5_PRIPA|nr:hypothetical protein PRIPAC_71341 [Pristionchus pacificus]|eukprot:PDM83767.1 hypothetical protein PRIPAC_30254 [Pristionchus pacificus]